MSRGAALLLVVGVATLVRVVAHHEVRDGPHPHLHRWTETDMAFYDRWARRIAAGDVLTEATMRPDHSWHAKVAREAQALAGATEPVAVTWDRWLGARTFYQDPLYPYLLAATHRLSGGRGDLALLLQATLGVVGSALVHALAWRLFDPTVALVAGIGAALLGPAIFYETVLLRESALVCVDLAAILALTAALGSLRGRWGLVAGLLLGIGCLLKSSTVLFVLVACGVVAHGAHDPRRVLRGLVVGVGLALVPLVARNVAVGAPPLGLAASGPFAFIAGNAADAEPAAFSATSRHMGAILAASDGRWPAVVVETLRTHASPWSWPTLLARKLAAFWHWYEIPDNADYYYFQLQAPWTAAVTLEFWHMAPLALAGLVLGGVRRRGIAPLLAYVGVGVTVSTLFFTVSRFRVPITLALVPLAAWTLVTLVRDLRARRWGRAAAGVLVTLAAGGTLLRPGPAHLVPRRADYGVGNEIVEHLARARVARGDAAGALGLIDRQLRTAPVALRDVEPGGEATRVPVLAAAVAGSFARLHALAAEIETLRDRPAAASRHRRRAAVLATIGAQYERRR